MHGFIISSSFLACLQPFASCFTAPSYRSFVAMCAGWILCLGRHTITGVMRSAGVVGLKHHTSFQRFFRSARWVPDVVGLTVLRLVLALVPTNHPVVVAVDDTLARHTGKRIASAGMHRDPLLSTATRVFFHFGHVWVVMAVVVQVPKWNKSFALPVLVRLYRPKKVCQKMGLKHIKKTEMAAEMTNILAGAIGDRELIFVGDNGYTNRAVLQTLPEGSCFVGRGRMDAAVFASPPARRKGEMGRPRVKGPQLPSPEKRANAQHAKWVEVDVLIYGRPARVKVLMFDALWYRAARGRLLRHVVIRDWPGHKKDDVLVCTDTTKSPAWIIQAFCLRWSLEETFHWCKSKLGLEDPQNRTEQAVQRTAPMSLWMYSLITYWYLIVGQNTRFARWPSLPWYQSKRIPAFSDMLATLRWETWQQRLLDQAGSGRLDQKSLEPLLEMVGYG